MSFKSVTLEEICIKITDGSHSSPKGIVEGYPMLSVKDMRENSFDYSSCKRINLKDFEKMKKNDCVPQNGDVLVAKDGSYLKHIFVARETKEEAVLSSIAIFRPNKEVVDSDYIKYVLLNPRMKRVIRDNYVSGSAVPRIVLKDFKKIKMNLPEITEQKALVKVLLDIDKKIEINNQINKTLENMAQAIFKQWFVDFEFPNEDGKPYKSSGGQMVESELGMIPEGWEVKKVEEVARIIRGASPRPIKDFIRTEGIPWVKISDASSSNTRFISATKEFIKEEGRSKSREVNVGTLILSNSATPGIPMIMKIDACVHDGWLIFNDFKHVTKEYMFHFLKENRTGILSLSNGSVFRNLKTDILKNYKIIVPCEDVISKVDVILKSIDNTIDQTESQNMMLIKLRDALLPKLMSGEIRVPLDNN